MIKKRNALALLLGAFAMIVCSFVGCKTESDDDDTVAVTGITFDCGASASIVQGASLTITATVAPANATNKAITWASSDTTIATVDEGIVIASTTKTGDVTITATAKDGSGISQSVVITVAQKVVPATAIALDASTLPVAKDSTGTLTATLTPANATSTVTWTSSDETIATVTNGIVTGVANGTVTITAACETYTATATVNVTVPFNGFDITIPQTFVSGEYAAKVFTSADSSTSSAAGYYEPAKVNGKRLETGIEVAIGDTLYFYADSKGYGDGDSDGGMFFNYYALGDAAVNAAAASNKAYVAIYPMSSTAASLKITIKARAAQASQSRIAFTDNNNVVLARTDDYMSAGTRTYYAYVAPGQKIKMCNGGKLGGGIYIYSITLEESTEAVSTTVGVIIPAAESVAATSVYTAGAPLTAKGTSGTVTAAVTPAGADQAVTWASSDSTIASVDSATGVVTPLATGTATLTATCSTDSSLTGTCDVTVIAVTGVTLDQTTIDSTKATVGGPNVTLNATVEPALAEQTVTWTSSDSSKVTVSSAGVLAFVAAGNATITATAIDGTTVGTCAVTVGEAVTINSVTLTKNTTTIYVGASETLAYTIDPSGQAVTWTSSDPTVATVSDAGKVTALAAGTTTITCASYTDSTKSSTCTVTVEAPVDQPLYYIGNGTAPTISDGVVSGLTGTGYLAFNQNVFAADVTTVTIKATICWSASSGTYAGFGFVGTNDGMWSDTTAAVNYLTAGPQGIKGGSGDGLTTAPTYTGATSYVCEATYTNNTYAYTIYASDGTTVYSAEKTITDTSRVPFKSYQTVYPTIGGVGAGNAAYSNISVIVDGVTYPCTSIGTLTADSRTSVTTGGTAAYELTTTVYGDATASPKGSDAVVTLANVSLENLTSNGVAGTWSWDNTTATATGGANISTTATFIPTDSTTYKKAVKTAVTITITDSRAAGTIMSYAWDATTYPVSYQSGTCGSMGSSSTGYTVIDTYVFNNTNDGTKTSTASGKFAASGGYWQGRNTVLYVPIDSSRVSSTNNATLVLTAKAIGSPIYGSSNGSIALTTDSTALTYTYTFTAADTTGATVAAAMTAASNSTVTVTSTDPYLRIKLPTADVYISKITLTYTK